MQINSMNLESLEDENLNQQEAITSSQRTLNIHATGIPAQADSHSAHSVNIPDIDPHYTEAIKDPSELLNDQKQNVLIFANAADRANQFSVSGRGHKSIAIILSKHIPEESKSGEKNPSSKSSAYDSFQDAFLEIPALFQAFQESVTKKTDNRFAINPWPVVDKDNKIDCSRAPFLMLPFKSERGYEIYFFFSTTKDAFQTTKYTTGSGSVGTILFRKGFYPRLAQHTPSQIRLVLKSFFIEYSKLQDNVQFVASYRFVNRMTDGFAKKWYNAALQLYNPTVDIQYDSIVDEGLTDEAKPILWERMVSVKPSDVMKCKTALKEFFITDYCRRMPTDKRCEPGEYLTFWHKLCKANSQMDKFVVLTQCIKEIKLQQGIYFDEVDSRPDPPSICSELLDYCKQNPLSTADVMKIDELLEDPEQQDFIRSICIFARGCVIREDMKRSCLYLHGAPNSGKTTMTRFVDEVFTSVKLTSQDPKHMVIDGPRNTEANIVLINEGQTSIIFGSDRENYKRAMEGLGLSCRLLYENARNKFKGCYFVVNTQALPKIALYDPETKDKDKLDWFAFKQRMSICRLDHSHSGRSEKIKWDCKWWAHVLYSAAVSIAVKLNKVDKIQPIVPFSQDLQEGPVPNLINWDNVYHEDKVGEKIRGLLNKTTNQKELTPTNYTLPVTEDFQSFRQKLTRKEDNEDSLLYQGWDVDQVFDDEGFNGEYGQQCLLDQEQVLKNFEAYRENLTKINKTNKSANKSVNKSANKSTNSKATTQRSASPTKKTAKKDTNDPIFQQTIGKNPQGELLLEDQNKGIRDSKYTFNKSTGKFDDPMTEQVDSDQEMKQQVDPSQDKETSPRTVEKISPRTLKEPQPESLITKQEITQGHRPSSALKASATSKIFAKAISVETGKTDEKRPTTVGNLAALFGPQGKKSQQRSQTQSQGGSLFSDSKTPGKEDLGNPETEAKKSETPQMDPNVLAKINSLKFGHGRNSLSYMNSGFRAEINPYEREESESGSEDDESESGFDKSDTKKIDANLSQALGGMMSTAQLELDKEAEELRIKQEEIDRQRKILKQQQVEAEEQVQIEAEKQAKQQAKQAKREAETRAKQQAKQAKQQAEKQAEKQAEERSESPQKTDISPQRDSTLADAQVAKSVKKEKFPKTVDMEQLSPQGSPPMGKRARSDTSDAKICDFDPNDRKVMMTKQQKKNLRKKKNRTKKRQKLLASNRQKQGESLSQSQQLPAQTDSDSNDTDDEDDSSDGQNTSERDLEVEMLEAERKLKMIKVLAQQKARSKSDKKSKAGKSQHKSRSHDSSEEPSEK